MDLKQTIEKINEDYENLKIQKQQMAEARERFEKEQSIAKRVKERSQTADGQVLVKLTRATTILYRLQNGAEAEPRPMSLTALTKENPEAIAAIAALLK